MGFVVPDFDDCYRHHFPMYGQMLGMMSAMDASRGGNVGSIEHLTRSLLGDIGKEYVGRTDYDLAEQFFAALIMHVAYHHFDGDLEGLLCAFNWTSDFDMEMRLIYQATV